MRILLDQGIFDMRNAGQNAMLQVAVERMRRFWPDASIHITTVAPNILKIYFPEAYPVSPDGRHTWYQNPGRSTRIRQILPAYLLKLLLETREEIWYRWPEIATGSARRKLWSFFRRVGTKITLVNNVSTNEKKTIEYKPNYTDVVSGYDLFVATGSQYLCDHAKNSGIQVLNRLEAASRLGIPTVMVGQGIGPMIEQDLISRAKEVLPLVDLIFVRERLEGPRLLASFGVEPVKVYITGDDAIELAYRARSSIWGNGIGVSVRWMPSTQIQDDDLHRIAPILWKFAKKYQASLIGLPISLSIHERDDRCVHQILAGYEDNWMSRMKFPTPMEIIRNTQRCRLVVTGTFHGALLALAQGIPVICPVRSSLYKNKFFGLVDLFGSGCQVVEIDDLNMETLLISAIEATWQSAEQLRPQLLEAAVKQIGWGQAAYNHLYNLVESKRDK